MEWVLETGPWHIQHKSLFLKKWELGMQPLQVHFNVAPVWVKLSNIPIEMYSQLGFGYIDSALGRPLYTDKNTAGRQTLEFAKVCIEIKADSILPRKVRVALPNGNGADIFVEVAWIPARCKNCVTFEHAGKACPYREEEKVKAAEVQVLEEIVAPEAGEIIDELTEQSAVVVAALEALIEEAVEPMIQELVAENSAKEVAAEAVVVETVAAKEVAIGIVAAKEVAKEVDVEAVAEVGKVGSVAVGAVEMHIEKAAGEVDAVKEKTVKADEAEKVVAQTVAVDEAAVAQISEKDKGKEVATQEVLNVLDSLKAKGKPKDSKDIKDPKVASEVVAAKVQGSRRQRKRNAPQEPP